MENVKQDASIGTNILRVSASDEDADNNGAIIYTLNAGSNPADLEYFEIQPESGWIVLKKPLDVSIKIGIAKRVRFLGVNAVRMGFDVSAIQVRPDGGKDPFN